MSANGWDAGCPSSNDGAYCQLALGHEGHHEDGGYIWAQRPREVAAAAAKKSNQDEVQRLRAKVADLTRRIRIARKEFMFTEGQWDDLRDYACYYLDERRVIGEWYHVAKAVRAMLNAATALETRKPLSRRTKRKP